MAHCSRCGFELPEGSGFCPNCGSPTRGKPEIRQYPTENVVNILNKGLLGAFLSISIAYFMPTDLYFIPSFVASIIVVYLSRAKRFKDASLIALTVYLFADAIITSIMLGSLYASKQTLSSLYGDYVPSFLDVIMYTISPITALIAGYIGARFAPGREEESLPISHGRREEGSGGVVYVFGELPKNGISSHLTRFKYYLGRSSIPIV